MKIATVLPYKENYTFSKAQAAAIWVCDFFKYSKFKNTNFIYGNTKSKDYLTKNYVNIKINNEDFRNGDVLHSQASIDKIQNNLGYIPKHSIMDGINEALPWYVKRFEK